jgi:hypothetical protein
LPEQRFGGHDTLAGNGTVPEITRCLAILARAQVGYGMKSGGQRSHDV